MKSASVCVFMILNRRSVQHVVHVSCQKQISSHSYTTATMRAQTTSTQKVSVQSPRLSSDTSVCCLWNTSQLLHTKLMLPDAQMTQHKSHWHHDVSITDVFADIQSCKLHTSTHRHRTKKRSWRGGKWVRKSDYLVSHGNMSTQSIALIENKHFKSSLLVIR